MHLAAASRRWLAPAGQRNARLDARLRAPLSGEFLKPPRVDRGGGGGEVVNVVDDAMGPHDKPVGDHDHIAALPRHPVPFFGHDMTIDSRAALVARLGLLRALDTGRRAERGERT